MTMILSRQHPSLGSRKLLSQRPTTMHLRYNLSGLRRTHGPLTKIGRTGRHSSASVPPQKPSASASRRSPRQRQQQASWVANLRPGRSSRTLATSLLAPTLQPEMPMMQPILTIRSPITSFRARSTSRSSMKQAYDTHPATGTLTSRTRKQKRSLSSTEP